MSLLLCAALPSMAGQADLALSVTLSPPAPYRPGQTVTMTLTVTNHGPDTAGADALPFPLPPISASTVIRVNNAYRLPLFFEPVLPTDCVFEQIPFDPAPGDVEGIIFVVYFPEIDPGQSHSCDQSVYIDESVTGGAQSTWFVYSNGDTDPVPENNTLGVFFSFESAPIPALSHLAMFALIGSFLALAAWHRRS